MLRFVFVFVWFVVASGDEVDRIQRVKEETKVLCLCVSVGWFYLNAFIRVLVLSETDRLVYKL